MSDSIRSIKNENELNRKTGSPNKSGRRLNYYLRQICPILGLCVTSIAGLPQVSAAKGNFQTSGSAVNLTHKVSDVIFGRAREITSKRIEFIANNLPPGRGVMYSPTLNCYYEYRMSSLGLTANIAVNDPVENSIFFYGQFGIDENGKIGSDQYYFGNIKSGNDGRFFISSKFPVPQELFQCSKDSKPIEFFFVYPGMNGSLNFILLLESALSGALPQYRLVCHKGRDGLKVGVLSTPTSEVIIINNIPHEGVTVEDPISKKGCTVIYRLNLINPAGLNRWPAEVDFGKAFESTDYNQLLSYIEGGQLPVHHGLTPSYKLMVSSPRGFQNPVVNSLFYSVDEQGYFVYDYGKRKFSPIPGPNAESNDLVFSLIEIREEAKKLVHNVASSYSEFYQSLVRHLFNQATNLQLIAVTINKNLENRYNKGTPLAQMLVHRNGEMWVVEIKSVSQTRGERSILVGIIDEINEQGLSPEEAVSKLESDLKAHKIPDFEIKLEENGSIVVRMGQNEFQLNYQERKGFRIDE